ncbi:hypothetical protein ACOJQI_07740 [Bacillus salacetis]|uniref:hypothetical protein n=1 Tax=Bacillus salacetis TaxID=2315464 RepID=UPI003BA04913
MLERSIQGSYQTLSKLQYPSKLMDGQMIFAKMDKLLPEGMAVINYNGQKTIAKLEAPLTAGNHYLFKVEVGDEGILKLRVISASPANGKNPNPALPEKLLNELSLPQRGNIKQLISMLVKNSLPFTEKELVLMSDLLKETPDKNAGIEALIKIKGANITVSKPLFYSHLHGKSMEPMSSMIEGLETALQKSSSKSAEMNEVLRILSGIKQIETPYLLRKAAGRASDMIKDLDISNSIRTSALKLLQALGLLPEETTLQSVKTSPDKEGRTSQLSSHFINSSPSAAQVRGKLTALLEFMSAIKTPDREVQAFIREIESVVKDIDSEKGTRQELIRPALALLSEGDKLILQKGTVHELNDLERFKLLFGMHSGKEEGVHSSFKRLVQQLDDEAAPEQPAIRLLQQLLSAEDGIHKENLPAIIKELISKLGINYEAKLAAGAPALNESLKMSLIALLQEIPAGEIREYGERLLYKLNGQSVLSGENGPLQIIQYQFPLSWLNQTTDVTMQWSGRKMENGQLDPAYCRILFYLELENIKEVVVDMGVQNRAVTLNIYNDTPALKDMAAPFSLVLKQGLEMIGYKVSALNFKQSESGYAPERMYQEMTGEVSYSGVDLKI